MTDPSRINQELIEENTIFKQRIQELEKSEPERKRVEDELQIALRRFQIVLSNLYDGILVVSKDNRNDEGEYVYLNEAHVKVYGYENAEELIGKSWRILYDSDYLVIYGSTN